MKTSKTRQYTTKGVYSNNNQDSTQGHSNRMLMIMHSKRKHKAMDNATCHKDISSGESILLKT
jgi:hypothetical protein